MAILIKPDESRPWRAFCRAQADEGGELWGVYSCPNERWLCIIAGGYAHIIDVFARKRVVDVPLEEVTQVVSATVQGMMILVGIVSVVALGRQDLVWETRRVSWDGVVIYGIEDDQLLGRTWDAVNQIEVPLRIDVLTGATRGGVAPLL